MYAIICIYMESDPKPKESSTATSTATTGTLVPEIIQFEWRKFIDVELCELFTGLHGMSMIKTRDSDTTDTR